jgi:uncharacterized membrane protein
MNLCKYKNLIGKEGTGVHSYRFLNVAIIDVIVTIFGAYIIHLIFKIKFIYILIFSFLLGIVCHRLFCVRTTVDKWLFKE